MNKKEKSELIRQIQDFHESSGLTPDVVRYWSNLQVYHHQEGNLLIEFLPQNKEDQYWRCLIMGENVPPKRMLIKLKKTSANSPSEINEDLHDCFTGGEIRVNISFWKKMENALRLSGFFVPIQDIAVLEKKQLEQISAHLLLMQEYFPFVTFLDSLKKETLAKDHFLVPIGVKALWCFFQCHVNFLLHIHKKIRIPIDEVFFYNLHGQQNQKSLFTTELPSEQIMYLLYVHLENFYTKDKKQQQFEKLIASAIPEIQTFFKKQGAYLRDFYKNGFSPDKDYLPLETKQNIRNQLYAIIQMDYDLLKIQDLLDDQSGKAFLFQLPDKIRDLYDPSRTVSTQESLKVVVQNASIMDRIQLAADQNVSKPRPSIVPEPNRIYIEKYRKWYELNVQERIQLMNALDQALAQDIKKELSEISRKRWNLHLQNLLHSFIMPFIRWDLHFSDLVPQWNFLDQTIVKPLVDGFWATREQEEEEKETLNQFIEQLTELDSVRAIDNLIKEVKPFTFAALQEQWDQKSREHRTTIQNRRNYRLRRMREYGILEKDESLNYRKEIWLDEMLQIEEEVKPFILFVKKAFQAALPVRRSVEFNPYRHSHDGLEFDPETIQDQDKWIRAEVMRTLQKKVDHGDVEQVNAFCLDSSGSMDHLRMRNLFKILYLLTLGLEDRKSYDAFHFFSTFFIETANFTNLYTNRKLLFKILRKISTISEDGVLYGGGGGTNISDGVEQCHQRILKFVEEIKERDSEANVVCSLFVITDGEPSMGILDLDQLHDFIESKRQNGNVAIKGIYIKPPEDDSDFIPKIFGENNFVETTDFNEAVNKFVTIMSNTYKAQRKDFKWRKKKKKISRNQSS